MTLAKAKAAGKRLSGQGSNIVAITDERRSERQDCGRRESINDGDDRYRTE